MESCKSDKYECSLEYLTQYRANLEDVRRLQKELVRMTHYCGPKNNLIAAYDSNKGGYVKPSYDSAVRTFTKISRNQQKIARNMNVLEDTMDALDNLESCERLALVMRYVDGYSIKTICDALSYSSRQSVYNLLAVAKEKFARNLGLNA